MKIGIIGVGKLGLAFALIFEQHGFDVIASSYKTEYVETLNKKIIDSVEPGIQDLLAKSINIDFTVDNHSVISNCDIIYVMVATPSLDSGDYDMSAVWNVVRDMQNHPGSVQNKILVIGCTTNPGVCKSIQQELAHRQVHVVYSPTFAAQGSVLANIQDPHTLLIGTDDQEVADKCEQVFSKIITKNTPRFRMSQTAAEIVKLSGNCRATAIISYTNMIGQVLVESGLEKDLDIAMECLNFVKINTKYKFGFGYGGPCYPRDNRSFVHYAKKLGIDFQLGKIVDEFNNSHPDYLTKYFVSKNSQKLPFYFDYVSYKKGVNIFEESQQLIVCKKLLSQGFKVYINPSKFLLPKIVEDLSAEFTDLVGFIALEDLTKQNIDVLQIDI
jgi:nucleotide sugar dehydrogenase